jgi:hypothetical protein
MPPTEGIDSVEPATGATAETLSEKFTKTGFRVCGSDTATILLGIGAGSKNPGGAEPAPAAEPAPPAAEAFEPLGPGSRYFCFSSFIFAARASSAF